MFTDMVGYTALTQSSEAGAMELLEKHNTLLRPMFSRFHGKEVKTVGDSFLVEFDSALDALSCAAEIQSELHEHNLRAASDGRIRLRIGIHLGDVIHKDGDVFGDAVNISSRIEPLAEPEGVCISRQVYDQVRNKFGLPLLSMGDRELKNVSVPVEVYCVQMPWDSPMGMSGPESRRVAVLPFSNMSPDSADEFFADGMTEEIISTVSRIEGTEVISRTSVMQYKRSPKPIREISRELDVGTVLEGSVRKAGNRLRVTVQMIDAAKDRHLWAESYDRNFDDVFAIQSDIAGKVAEALKTRMARETPRSVGLTENADAYTDYLRAKQVANEGGEANTRKAISLLESALAKDPEFSKAYAELARSLRHMGMYEDYTSTTKKAEEMGRRAVATGPDVAEAHAAMAGVHIAMDRFDEAREELETAVRLNPNLSDAQSLLGEITGAFGRLDEAIAYYRKAYALDPVSPHAVILLSDVLRVSGRIDEAMSLLSRAKQLYPSNVHVSQGIAICHAESEDYVTARKILEEALRANPDEHDVQASIAIVDALEGKREEALEGVRGLSTDGWTTWVGARLVVNCVLGNLDEAFVALDELAQVHAWPFIVKSEPLLRPMQKDPRFADFCRKVGIPPP